MATPEFILPSTLFMDLDRSGPVPLYFQVSQRIEQSIVDGDLKPGARLENEIALGERLGLSRPTIRRAIQELVDKGLLVRRRGIGTQVVHGHVTRGVELTSLFEDLARAGKTPSTRVLHAEVVPADARIAAALSVDEGAPTLYLHRVRLAEDVPVAVLENWLPEEYSTLLAEEIAAHGLYQLLRARGVTMRVAKQRIGARNATNAESELLEVERHSAVLTMERTAFDSTGRAVEFGRHCYRPDLYSFEFTLVEK